MSMNQVELKAFEKQTAGGMGRVSLRVTCRELPAGLWVWVGVGVGCHAGLPVTWVGVVCLLCSLTCCTGCLWGRERHAGNNGCMSFLVLGRLFGVGSCGWDAYLHLFV